MYRSAAVLFALAWRQTATAEVWRIRSESEVRTKAGSVLTLPPVRCVDETGWSRLDAEMRRLQTYETRRKAEDAVAQPDVSLGGAALLLLVGAALGAGVVLYAK